MQTFRNLSTPAIVIRRERMGESHKGLVLLTADLGLVHAAAYGAWKMHSALRTGSEPFAHSLARLYHDPVKNTYKVTDLEVRESFEGLRTDLGRIEAASLWAEVVLKSIAAGETTGGLYRLLLACLRALEAGGADRAPYATAQFLWRFLDLAGYRPDASACERCGRAFGEAEGAAWLAAPGGIACGACAGGAGLPLSAGARRYLEATRDLDLAASLAISLDPSSLAGLGKALQHAIRGVLETDLASLRSLGQR
ncbi:MAG: DNA repair protein RecO [Spirochaetes bacterium]|nr:DNA repair protein RecO [Spirochaetota bacterium]